MNDDDFKKLLTYWSLIGTISNETLRSRDTLRGWNCFKRTIRIKNNTAVVVYNKTIIDEEYEILYVDIINEFGISKFTHGHYEAINALENL